MNLRNLSLFFSLLLALSLSAATPKYIFYFIGDGMGMGHVMATETYNRQVLKNNDKILMMQFPVASQAMTYSYTGPITDSAAAGTALATGNKTRNGMIGMTPDTIAVNSIAKVLKDNGYGIGITTTVPIDDATPSVFYAHQPSRKMYHEIGMDMIASGYDFFAGSPLRGNKDNSLSKLLDKNNYFTANSISALKSHLGKGKIYLTDPKTADSQQLGYTIDSIAGALTLPQITEAAISHLSQVSPDKFFLMVEGGNIDWVAHSNDGGAVIKEILNFNEALKYAYDFYLSHPDETLIVVTADHDTGGMTIGVKKGPELVDFKYIDYQKVSKETFSKYCSDIIKSGKKITWGKMKTYLTENFGLYSMIPISKDEDEELQEEFTEVFEKHNSHDNKTLYSSFSSFVEDVFNLYQHKIGFGWTSNNHTGNLVPVYAIGVGAEEFSKINNNIEIPRKIAKISGIDL